MTEGLESLQEQIKKLTVIVEENNSMLHSIQRRARMSILLSCIKWLFIIGVTFGSFYFLQPLMDKAFSAYTQIGELSNPFSSVKNTENATSTDDSQSGFINAMRAYMPR